MDSIDLARLAVGAGLDRKAVDPVIIDLRGMTSIADAFVILTGTSDRHVQAVAERIMEAFHALRHKILGEEGFREGRWVLLDYGEVVVHVFLEPVRDYYDLERLWVDAPRVRLDGRGEDGDK